ncbi:MAG: tellurite resistance TerB family protein, partial [Notoacmeibacter sp.]
IATLGFKAYQNYKSGQPILPQKADAALPDPSVVEGTAFDQTAQGAAGEMFTLSLVRIMIDAARADGHIDEAERAAILGKLKTSGLNEEVQSFIDNEISNPVDLDGLVASAETEEQKVELYTAARLTISPDTRAERGFLDMLAGRLNLPDALVDHIDATVKGVSV